MPEKLNDFETAHMRQLRDIQMEMLRADAIRLPTTTDALPRRCAVLEGMRYEAYQIGVLSYALDESLENVRNYFGMAVQAALEWYGIKSVDYGKNPLVHLECVYLEILLARWQDARTLANLESYAPGSYDNGKFKADTVIMEYIAAVFAALTRSTEEAIRIAQENITQNESRKEAYVGPFLLRTQALLAILEMDAQRLNEALAKIVHRHSIEARKGRLREKVDGLLCLDGLALAAWGEAAGLPIQIESPYLPLALLQR